MPDTQARIGYGTTVEMAELATPTAFTYIAEVSDITPPSETTGTEDATHMQSPNRTQEFIDTLTDPGEFAFGTNLVPGSPSDLYLRAAKGKRKWIRVTFPNGVQLLFVGVRTGYETAVPTAGKMTASVKFKVSGSPTLTEIAAPRSLTAPLISGVAKVGAPLLIDSGIWAGALELEYQWKADAAAVAGATGASFVPLVANVGDVITCEITGLNDNFETVVVSAATVAVVA